MCGISAAGKILGSRQRNIGWFQIESPFVKNWLALNSHILFLEPNILWTHVPSLEFLDSEGPANTDWYRWSYYPCQTY